MFLNKCILVHFSIQSKEDEYCAVYLYRVPYSRRTTITTCLAADLELFVDEVANHIADDVDSVEESNWIDLTLDALGLVAVLVLVIVFAVKKSAAHAPTDAPARDPATLPRPANRRDTVFELPLNTIRI